MLTDYKPNRPLRSVETPSVHTKQGSPLLAIITQLPEEIRCAETLNPDSKLICLAVHLLNEHCATSQLTALCIIILYPCVCVQYIYIYIYNIYIYIFFFIVFIIIFNVYFTSFLCEALWISTVYELCYINKLALPCACHVLRMSSSLTTFSLISKLINTFHFSLTLLSTLIWTVFTV